MPNETNKNEKNENIPKILSTIGSPLKLFALAVIFSNTAFGVAATKSSPENFKYCIHMFLAVFGAIILISLWSPRSLYHPVELINIPDNKMPAEHPIIATIILCLALAAYMIYYYLAN